MFSLEIVFVLVLDYTLTILTNTDIVTPTNYVIGTDDNLLFIFVVSYSLNLEIGAK